jgi:uncharacterized protein
MANHNGSFVWYELMTTDLAAAQTFYSQVLGWQCADSGMPGMQYTLASAGTDQVAGMMTLPAEQRAAGVPPNWSGYIAVEDVDSKTQGLASMGATVMHPATDIPGVGRFSVVGDPQGAVFVLFKDAGGDYKLPAPGTPGTVGWHELMTSELDPAWNFYSSAFGWTKDEAFDMGPMGLYQLFSAGSGPTGGMMKRPPDMPVSAWMYYFNVEALDAAIARVKSGGGQIYNGPQEVPGGSWVAQCADPQGAMFSLVAAKR